MSRLIFDNDIRSAVGRVIEEIAPSSVHVVTDENVARLVLPVTGLDRYPVVAVRAGDSHKDLESLTAILDHLTENGATRRSLVINLGGGMVTDMGGFAASIFKRGIACVNVPTTLLGAVDAAVGGKTGINFHGLKNEIGTFSHPRAVVFSTVPFATLPERELLSGYGEMLKHSLLQGTREFNTLCALDIRDCDSDRLLDVLRDNVMFKKSIVDADPTEQGPRKALNLGHTAGHALEEMFMRKGRPVEHGIAVANGLLVEMIISHLLHRFPAMELYRMARVLKEDSMRLPLFTCDDYPDLLALMAHDKKNTTPGEINFTLLSAPGQYMTDLTATPATIRAALDIYRDMME